MMLKTIKMAVAINGALAVGTPTLLSPTAGAGTPTAWTPGPTMTYSDHLTVDKYWCDPDGTIHYTVTCDDYATYGYLFNWEAGKGLIADVCEKDDAEIRYTKTEDTPGEYTYNFEIDPECQKLGSSGLQEAYLQLYFSYSPTIGLLKETVSQTLKCVTIAPEYTVEYIFSNVTLPETVQDPGEPDSPLGFSIMRMTDGTFATEKLEDTVFGGEEVFFEFHADNDDYKWNMVSCILSEVGSTETYTLFDLYDDTECVEDFLSTKLWNHVVGTTTTWRLSYNAFTFADGNDVAQTQKLTCTIVGCHETTVGHCLSGTSASLPATCEADFTFV